MEYPYSGWKNKGGTSDRNAPGGSWKQYWQNHSDGQKWPDYCCVAGCTEKATDGAHMYCSKVDGREWIIPTCHFHNMQKDVEFDLKRDMPSKLVSANISL